MSDRERARPPPGDRGRTNRSRSRSTERSARSESHTRPYGENEPVDPRISREGGYTDRGGGRGGGGGYGGRGGYHQGGEGQGGYQAGGDRGGYGGEGRGGYQGGRGGGGYGNEGRGGYQGGGGYGDRGGGGGGGGYGGGGGGYGDRGGGGGYGDRGGGRGGYGDRGGGRGGYGDRGGGRGGGRGGYGGGGNVPDLPARDKNEPIELYTNFFEVVTNPNWTLYQYHVDFEPAIESKRLRLGLFKEHEHIFGNKAFDGMTLYCLKKLDADVTELESLRKYDESKIKITIKYTNSISTCSSEMIRMFNIIFKRCLLRCNYKEFGRDRAYYDFSKTHDLSKYRLRVATGYKASMDIYTDKIFLCTEMAHKLINADNVFSVIEDIFNKNGSAGKAICFEQIVGQTVMTNYNNKTYRVDDIAWDASPKDKFMTRKEGEISFIDYYRKHYDQQIKNLSQPLLVSRPKEKDKRAGQKTDILLIPEFCALTGTILLKDFARDFTMKKELDSITKLSPQVRYQRLNEFLSQIKNKPEAREDFSNWKMKLNDEVVKLNAYILPNITVQFDGSTITNTERGWDKQIRNAKHLTDVPLNNWIILFMPRDQSKAEALGYELTEVARGMQLSFRQGQLCKLPDGRGNNAITFVNGIRDKINEFNPQMIVCLVPNSNKDIYDSIKKTCCLEFGIPSQVVTSNIININNMAKTKSVVTKVAIQMNCKLGGEPWGVVIPMKNVMIVGMDFYKDSSQKNMSVAAFVANTNAMQDNKLNCTRFFSRCALQEKGQEFANNLQVFMKDALIKYREKNNVLPDRIFVYRDGVSDGQFSGVAEYEVPQMKAAFTDISENYAPKLTVLVVKKRGNSRFFWKGGRNEFQNAPMGTVIDNTIVKNPGAEFYLISQSTNQGTVSPTHFHIVYGQNELQADRMQNLTFRLTHLYFNWPGQIRVPAPCHYAQKLAHLVGESLHQPQHPALDDLLFYL